MEYTAISIIAQTFQFGLPIIAAFSKDPLHPNCLSLLSYYLQIHFLSIPFFHPYTVHLGHAPLSLTVCCEVNQLFSSSTNIEAHWPVSILIVGTFSD